MHRLYHMQLFSWPVLLVILEQLDTAEHHNLEVTDIVEVEEDY